MEMAGSDVYDVDVGRHDTYVLHRMNLLLLLSALLSALTGVVTGGRAERVPQAVSAQANAARVADAAVRVATRRPISVPPSRKASSTSFESHWTSPAAVEPLYAARRRE